MAMTVGALARLVAGTLHGDTELPITEAAPIEVAGPGSITFLADPKKAAQLSTCKASAILVGDAVAESAYPKQSAVIVVNDPLGAMCVVAESFFPPPAKQPAGVHPTAVVDPSAILGEGVSVGPFAIVEARVILGDYSVVMGHAVVREGAKIGLRTEIHSHAVIYPRSEIGDRCIIYSGAIIGRDGFGFRMVDGAHRKIPQLGAVRLGNDVEIGANSTIDCATFGWTTVGDGTKIDNQVMIGHNCSIGRHNILVAHVGISGSSKTGDYTVLAGKVGIADHVTIGSQVVVGAGTGVHADLPGRTKYMAGIPCMPEHQARRVGILVTQLPELRNRVRSLEKRLGVADPDETETVRRAG
jgi:UDP-3-O-[3-hydroxymyristoyl] glucosamine N-acyltransferase